MAAEKVELFDKDGNSRGYYTTDNRLNDLTGREWVYWTKSVINQSYPANMQHRLRSRHGAQKPPELCADLIRVFTKKDQLVLDPMAGVGGTLLGAGIAGRRALGIEINPQWVEIYQEVCRREDMQPQEMLLGDACLVQKELLGRGIAADFVLTDVPYWQMDRVSRSRGKFKRVGEEATDRRKSKLSAFAPEIYGSKEEWLEQLRLIFEDTIALLAPRGYMAVFIGDMYHSGQYHFLSADLAGMIQRLGMTLKANPVWYDVSKSLHVYGYRYEYIPSMIHQSILVFRKRDEPSA